MKTETYGYIKSGVLSLSNPKRFKDDLSTLPDCEVTVIVRKRGKRSTAQNSYIHMMFGLIARGFYEIGYREIKEMEQAKEIMKRMFLTTYIYNDTGGKIEVVKGTSELNKEEMSEFIDQCIQFAAENLMIEIPPPGTQTEIFAQ